MELANACSSRAVSLPPASGHLRKQRNSGSPELPLTFPDNIGPKQQIRDRVRGDGVAEPTFAKHKPLVTERAENTDWPLIAVHTAKHDSRNQKRAQIEVLQRHAQEINFNHVAVEEGP